MGLRDPHRTRRHAEYLPRSALSAVTARPLARLGSARLGARVRALATRDSRHGRRRPYRTTMRTTSAAARGSTASLCARQRARRSLPSTGCPSRPARVQRLRRRSIPEKREKPFTRFSPTCIFSLSALLLKSSKIYKAQFRIVRRDRKFVAF